MTRNIEGVRRDSSLLRKGYRLAKKQGDIKGAMGFAEAGDRMGIPVGRTSNDAALEGAGENRFGLELAQQRRPMPASGLDAYDNRHSSESGVGVGGYDFSQRGNQSLRTSTSRGGADPLTDSFRSAWQSASTQEEKDRIVEDADAQGVPLSSAGQAVLARRRERPMLGAQGSTGSPGVSATDFQGPVQPGHNVRQASAEPSLLPPAETEQVLLNRKVDSLRSYFTPEAAAARETARSQVGSQVNPNSPIGQTYDESIAEARSRGAAAKAGVDALPQIDPNGATAQSLNPDGSVNMGKVDQYAAEQQDKVRGLDRRNQAGMAKVIGQMEAERDIEALNREGKIKFAGDSLPPRAPGTDPLPEAKATWQRLYPGQRIPDRRLEGFAAIDNTPETNLNPMLEKAKDIARPVGGLVKEAKRWLDSDASRPYSPTGYNQLKNSLRR